MKTKTNISKWIVASLIVALSITGWAKTKDFCNVAGPSSLLFDGQDDYVDLKNDPSLQVPGDIISIMSWVKLDANNAGRWMGIMGKLDSGSQRGWALSRFSNGYFMFMRGNGSSIHGMYGGPLVTDEEWHHVAGVQDSTHTRLYVDGVLGHQMAKHDILDSGNNAFVGKLYNDRDERLFDGHIDDVRVYRSALSSAEVAQAMVTIPSTNPLMVGYWNFDEGTGNVAWDRSGFNNHGLLTTTAGSHQGPTWVNNDKFCDIAPQPLTISGYVRQPDLSAVVGVTVTASNGGTSAVTNSAGFYTVQVPMGWTGILTPVKTGYTMTPKSKAYQNLYLSLTNQSFVAIANVDTYYVDAVNGNDANTGHSEAQAFQTIQQGLNTAADQHTVIVLDGTYTGENNKGLDFKGKTIKLRSKNGAEQTVIDCQNSGRAFYFHNGENNQAVVQGFTLTNGNTYQGGAIYCLNSSPTIAECVIRKNTSTNGGAVYCRDNSNVVIQNCEIRNNSYSGGVRFDNSSGQLLNCLLVNNTASVGAGGAIRCDNGYHQVQIVNCTVAYNTTTSNGGGLWCRYTNVNLKNCIFWGNQASSLGSQISVNSGTVTVNYSDVEGGKAGVHNNGTLTWGTGNVDVDPLFGDPVNGEYHLQSPRGRYYPKLDLWVMDEDTSPVIDAGDPVDPVAEETEPNGKRINMGAYGGTTLASRSHEECVLVKDENGDGVIDYTDLFIAIERWLNAYTELNPQP